MATKDSKPDRKPKRLWILMHHGYEGWLPSMDHFCAWRTKKAALKKIKQLGEKGRIYRAFPYVPDQASVAPPSREKGAR